MLFRNAEADDETFAKAEALLDELRAESPLRHRLETELVELRKLRKSKQTAKPSKAAVSRAKA
jgi:hypothetical protein